MAKMPTKREQQRFNKWLKEYQRMLLLTHWTVEVLFSLTSDPSNGEDTCLISCTPDVTYTRLFITVWQDFWGEPEDTQRRSIVHELVHAPVAPIGEMATRAVKRKMAIQKDVDNAEEQLTQWFTNVIFNLLQSRK